MRSSSARPLRRPTDSSQATRSTRRSTALGSAEDRRHRAFAEYVFEARPGRDRAGQQTLRCFWMNERDLAKAFELDGAFNNVIVDVAPGGDAGGVMAELDRLLAPYAGWWLRDGATIRRRRGLMTNCGCCAAFRRVSRGLSEHCGRHVERRADAADRLQREQIAQLKPSVIRHTQGGVHYSSFHRHRGRRDGAGRSSRACSSETAWWTSITASSSFPNSISSRLGDVRRRVLVSAGAAFLGVIGAVAAGEAATGRGDAARAAAEYQASLFERVGLTRL